MLVRLDLGPLLGDGALGKKFPKAFHFQAAYTLNRARLKRSAAGLHTKKKLPISVLVSYYYEAGERFGANLIRKKKSFYPTVLPVYC